MDTHDSPSQPDFSDASGAPESPTGGRHGGGAMLRILLVEDDDGDARLVSDDLSERLPGIQLIRCGTLAEALAHQGESVDCVLLDLGLPDTTGVDAVAALRARMAPAPLVVLTGLDDEATGIAAVR